jgi:hypothetical protein
MSDRKRCALVDYLKSFATALAKDGRLEMPLWISIHHHGTQQRIRASSMARLTRTSRTLGLIR